MATQQIHDKSNEKERAAAEAGGTRAGALGKPDQPDPDQLCPGIPETNTQTQEMESKLKQLTALSDEGKCACRGLVTSGQVL